MRSGLCVVGAALAVFSTVALAQGGPEIKAAPAFKAAQLTALPTTGWLTNGGNLYNQRYSPLKQINVDNVKGLKALWRTGMGSGSGPGTAGQAQILSYEGTLYVSNGVSDVFAIDVESGKILWSYQGKPDPRGGSPIGRASRGVAIGDGKVFVGTHGCAARGPRSAHGQGDLENPCRELAGRFRDHGRAAVLRRARHRRLQRR